MLNNHSVYLVCFEGNDLADALEALTLLFADDVKMVTPRPQSMKLHTSLIAAWDWSQKWDLPTNPAQCNYPTIGQEIPLRSSFFPDGFGTSIPLSKLVKDLGVQVDNVFSPSANKARRLIFTIRR